MTATPATASSNGTTSPAPPVSLGIVLATLEALRGQRALHQVRTRMTRPAFESLLALLATGKLAGSRVGRVSLQMPHSFAVEATASIFAGGRWLACVIRLDSTRSGKWVCSELGVVGLAP